MALSPEVQKLIDNVAANTSAVQSAIAGLKVEQTQIADLQTQITALQPGQPIDAEDLAAITKAADDLGATNAALQVAVPAKVTTP